MEESPRSGRPIALAVGGHVPDGMHQRVADWLESIGHGASQVHAVTVWTPHDVDLTVYNVDEHGQKYQSWHSGAYQVATSDVMVKLTDPVPGWFLEAFDGHFIRPGGERVERAA